MITLGQAKFTAFGKLATAVALSAAFCSAHAQNAKDSEHEQRFWERCAIVREFAEQPDLPCVYTPPEDDGVIEERSTPVSWSAIEAP